jgi:hypothetical protein
MIIIYIIVAILFFLWLHSDETKMYLRYNEWYHLRIFNKNWKDLLASILWPITIPTILILAFYFWIKE